MNKLSAVFNKKVFLWMAAGIISIFLIIFASILFYIGIYYGKVYPNLSVAGINLSGNPPEKALTVLSGKLNTPIEVVLAYQDQTFKIKASDIGLTYDLPASAIKAFQFTRTGNILTDFDNRLSLLFYPKNLGLVYSIDNEKLAKFVSVIAGQISIDPINPSVAKTDSGIFVNRGTAGKEVNQEKLISAVMQNLTFNEGAQIQIPVENIDNTLDEAGANLFAKRAEKFLSKKISLKFEYQTITLQDTDIFKLLDPQGGFDDVAISNLTQKTASSIERDPQNPKFVFENGKVTEFQPALPGIKLDTEEFKNLLLEKLNELENSDQKNLSLDIPVAKTLPDVSTDKVNNLGIKELIGRGTSTYYHSIPGRVHNVALAASRINGTLVKPGETFSFNNTLGDVSAFTGYKQAYIISEGKTILGDGGGVCQVSTTLFRAALDAGLPILERQAHAYRVSYYEQDSPPGLDATVFSPSPDFKFTNDTGSHILIQAKADSKNYSLVFELYGTSDGRVSSISKPVTTGVTAPPEDFYQDDPSLPAGTIKQIDYKAWGARVSFNYLVKRDGQEIFKKTFVSNYKPWRAVYLRGTGPIQ